MVSSRSVNGSLTDIIPGDMSPDVTSTTFFLVVPARLKELPSTSAPNAYESVVARVTHACSLGLAEMTKRKRKLNKMSFG